MNFIYGKATTQITTAFDRIHLIIFALLWIACSSPFYGSIFGFIFSLRWADNWLMFDLNHFMCANASILLSGIIAIYAMASLLRQSSWEQLLWRRTTVLCVCVRERETERACERLIQPLVRQYHVKVYRRIFLLGTLSPLAVAIVAVTLSEAITFVCSEKSLSGLKLAFWFPRVSHTPFFPLLRRLIVSKSIFANGIKNLSVRDIYIYIKFKRKTAYTRIHIV